MREAERAARSMLLLEIFVISCAATREFSVYRNDPERRAEILAGGTGAKLLRVDGVPVANPAQARAAVNGRIGSVVMLDVIQDGEPLSVVVQRVRID